MKCRREMQHYKYVQEEQQVQVFRTILLEKGSINPLKIYTLLDIVRSASNWEGKQYGMSLNYSNINSFKRKPKGKNNFKKYGVEHSIMCSICVLYFI